MDPSNARALRNWDGPTGELWARHADALDAALDGYLCPLLDAAGAGGSARVLDVGCGSGRTTCAVAGTAGSVTGVDLSGPLLDVARRRARDRGLSNVDFRRADAQVADLGHADRVVSRFGVMFFGRPVDAFANLARALTPDGRMAVVVWRSPAHNEWFDAFARALADGRRTGVPPAAASASGDRPGPFSLSDPDRLRTLLTTAGFDEPEIVEARAPFRLGPDAGAAEPLARGLLADLFTDELAELDRPALDRIAESLRTSLDRHDGPGGVTYNSAAWVAAAALRR